MDTKTRHLADRAYRGAFGYGVVILSLCFLLSGCSYAPPMPRTPIERLDFSTPQSQTTVQQGLSLNDFDKDYHPEGRRDDAKLGLSEDASKALGCKFTDRFDTGSFASYRFSDQQSLLSLHLSMDGPSLSDPSRLQLNSVMLRYTHKFSKPPQSRRDRCRFPSNFQGFAGSTYNELFVRDNYPVWKELKSRLNLSK